MSILGPLGGVKSIKFSMGSGDKMEYIFGGALAVIIITFLSLSISATFCPPNGHPPGPDKFHFYCLNAACPSHKENPDEVVIPKEQIKREDMMSSMGQMAGAGGEIRRPECPTCNQRMLIPMRECPVCKKFFATDEMKAGITDSMAPGGADVICTNPECKTNITQWYRDRIPQ